MPNSVASTRRSSNPATCHRARKTRPISPSIYANPLSGVTEGSAAKRPALAVAQRSLHRAAAQSIQAKDVRLLLAAREMHDADYLVRRIWLDEKAALGIKGRRRVAGHPIGIGRQKRTAYAAALARAAAPRPANAGHRDAMQRRRN